jgi:predicted regulator of Ras-like GTPase activity (Roadblock/LC7/MglB family)
MKLRGDIVAALAVFVLGLGAPATALIDCDEPMQHEITRARGGTT